MSSLLLRRGLFASIACLAIAPRLCAQTDFYNLDRGRPLQVEDAYVIERNSLELQAAPLRLERGGRGRWQTGIEPSLTWGLLPRTHVEVGLPLALLDRPGARDVAALAGVDLEVMHTLNAETEALPAIGLALGSLLPAGGFGPSRPVSSARLMATRTFVGARRLHVNAQWAFGPDENGGTAPRGVRGPAGPGALELPRWLAGAALDWPLPLRSLLIGVESYAMRPLQAGEPVAWTTGAGARYQLDPRWVLDLGASRRWRGDSPAWQVTVGTAYAFGLRALIPGVGR